MARPKNPKRDQAFQLWLNSKEKMKLIEIAAELDLSDSQVRKWKNHDKGDAQLNGNVTKQKRGAPPGNDNAKRNNDNRKASALKHGFDLGLDGRIKCMTSPMQIRFLNGSKIIFKGMDKPQKLNSINMSG